MYHNRTIKISFKEDFVFTAEAKLCIGYLSTWALGSARYAFLLLSQGRDNEIEACYKEGDGSEFKTTYFICGVPDSDGKYTTHS
jgi:hypothetical protein